MTGAERRKKILQAVAEAVEDLLVDDRTDDPDLPPGQIEDAVLAQDVLFCEMTMEFELLLRQRIPVPPHETAYEAGQVASRVRNEQLQEAVQEHARQDA